MFEKVLILVLFGFLSFTYGQKCSPSAGLPTVCGCIANVITCSGRGLRAVPSFSGSVSAERLDLTNNNITILHANAFRNLHVKTINLDRNGINTIETNAFANVRPNVTTLILSNNKLTYLPHELSTLAVLSSLDVRGNPIKDMNFTNNVMKDLGDTIQEFKFGSEELEQWPRTTSHFQELKTLELDRASGILRIIPPEAFHSFRTTITKMTIKNTGLLAAPIGISSLRNLQTLHFDHNQKVGDRGVLLQAFVNPRTSLQTLSLIDDSLTRFPRVLRYLSALRNLTLDSNVLDFVNDEAIGLVSHVTKLSLRNCSLERVPGALSDLQGLEHLDLSENLIKSIERNDFEQLTRLISLTFTNNPLSYVSNDTFLDLHTLSTLDLSSTNLTLIPEAIQNIYRYRNHCLASLTVSGNKLDCMCELLWLWNLKAACRGMKIEGNCDTIKENVETYLNRYIPRCPAWLENNGHNIYPYHLPQKRSARKKLFRI